MTTAVVAVLALGISVTTAMFSVVDGVLLKRPQWPDADRLVIVHATAPDQRANPAFAGTWDRQPLGWSSWRDLQRAAAFEGAGAWMANRQILGTDRRDLVRVFYVSTSFMSLLDVRPAVGRRFSSDDDDRSSDAAIISSDLWHGQFGTRADIVGQRVMLAYDESSSPIPKTIIGVLPADFAFQGDAPDILLPLGLMSFNGSFEANRFLRVVAKRASGVSLAQAQAAAEPLVQRGDPVTKRGARVVTLDEDRFGIAGTSLWALLAAAAALLLTACSNAAGLLFVDAQRRRQEVAIRVALGASRRQVLAQFAAECWLLSMAAAVIGVLIGWWLTPGFLALAPDRIRSSGLASVDAHVALLAIALSTVAAFVSGFIPIVWLSKVPIRSTASATAGRTRIHRNLVIVQIALALVLVTGAALLGRAFIVERVRPLGFDPSHLAVVEIAPTAAQSMGPPAAKTSGRMLAQRVLDSGWMETARILDRLSAVTGVVGVAGTSVAPFTRAAPSALVRDADEPGPEHSVQWHVVTENYFDVLGLEAVDGRTLSADDRTDPMNSHLVISRSEFARLPPRAGSRALLWGGYRFPVVGVAPDIREQRAMSEDADVGALYLINMRAYQIRYLIVRTSEPPAAVLPRLRAAIGGFDKTIQVTNTTTMPELVAAATAQERFEAALSTTFGGAALALASVGLFSLMTSLVLSRRREIAIRMAIGASPADIRRLVFWQAAVIVGAGLACGLPLALLAGRFARTVLVAVPPPSSEAIAFATITLGAAAALAAAVPLIRAGRENAARVLQD